MTKTFMVSLTVDIDISVDAENEAQAREFAENEAYSLGDVSSVDILLVEESDD